MDRDPRTAEVADRVEELAARATSFGDLVNAQRVSHEFPAGVDQRGTRAQKRDAARARIAIQKAAKRLGTRTPNAADVQRKDNR